MGSPIMVSIANGYAICGRRKGVPHAIIFFGRYVDDVLITLGPTKKKQKFADRAIHFEQRRFEL